MITFSLIWPRLLKLTTKSPNYEEYINLVPRLTGLGTNLMDESIAQGLH